MKNLKVLTVAFFSCLFVFGLFASNIHGQKYGNFLADFRYSRHLLEPRNVSGEYNFDEKFNELINKARTEGKARVIVGFKLENYQPDANLTNSRQIEQRAAIKEKQAALLDGLSDFNINVVRQFDYIPFMSMEATADALAALRQNPDVNFIKEDEMQSPSLIQSIPILGGSPFGGASGGTFSGFSGAGRTVAILDTGVDKTHPLFNNRVVSEACYSRTTANSTSVCPGGVSSSTAPGSGVNCSMTIDGCDHGTHVAGIAAGGNPSINGNGVARDANIIAIQVFSQTTDCGSNPSPCTTSFVGDTIAGLERVYALRTTYNIDAVNLSLGSGRYFNYCDAQQSDYKAAIDNLRVAGIATISVSGNDGFTDSVRAPGCISSAFSVGSTNDGDAFPVDLISSFSNSASIMNLLAPGEVIISSIPGGSYDNSQGTSQAAPMVAGAWAVMKQRFPNDTVSQIFTRLKYGGVQVLDSRNGLVKPRIKIDAAMNTSNVDPCDLSTPISFGQTVNGTLSNTDCLLPFGNRADIHTFSGTQGQGVAITLSSSAFFPTVYLLDQNFAILGSTSGLSPVRFPQSGFFTLPSTGVYRIYTTSTEGNRFGNYTVNLQTNGCSFTVSSSSQNFAAAGGNGSFTVNSGAGCAWTAQSSAAWLTTNSTGNGNGTVNYTVAQNTSTVQRSATITVGGQVHTVTQSGAAAPTIRRPFDFDGDSKTDIGIFRPSAGEWWIRRSSNNQVIAAQFGQSTDKIVPADFTGDGKTDIAFFRPSTGHWYVLRSEDNSFYAFPFGQAGDKAVPADFDGDGKADPTVFRPSNAVWYTLRSSDGQISFQQFGVAEDIPLPNDFDGDGKADFGVFRPTPSEWWILKSTGGVSAVQFGSAGDKPTPADFTGDGKTDTAFYRPSNGFWYVLRSEDNSYYAFPFGTNGDIPVVGDYDGDGRADAAVFRPSNTTWYLQQTTNGFTAIAFGTAGDNPLPAAFTP